MVYVVHRFIHYNYHNQPLTPGKLVGVYTDIVNVKHAVEVEIQEFASKINYTKDYSSEVVIKLENFINDEPIIIYKNFGDDDLEIVIYRRPIVI